jgi:hypothetical protein
VLLLAHRHVMRLGHRCSHGCGGACLPLVVVTKVFEVGVLQRLPRGDARVGVVLQQPLHHIDALF